MQITTHRPSFVVVVVVLDESWTLCYMGNSSSRSGRSGRASLGRSVLLLLKSWPFAGIVRYMFISGTVSLLITLIAQPHLWASKKTFAWVDHFSLAIISHILRVHNYSQGWRRMRRRRRWREKRRKIHALRQIAPELPNKLSCWRTDRICCQST